MELIEIEMAEAGDAEAEEGEGDDDDGGDTAAEEEGLFLAKVNLWTTRYEKTLNRRFECTGL